MSKQVGMFTSRDFNAKNWTTTYPVMAFQNMTDEDAFWAMRTILSLAKLNFARLSRPASTPIRKTRHTCFKRFLKEGHCRDYWLRRVNPIARFSVEPHAEGIAVRFHDYMVESNFAYKARTKYEYEIKGSHYKSKKETTKIRLFWWTGKRWTMRR